MTPNRPTPDAVALAAQVIGRGGLVMLPTDTLYGLAVNPFNAAAVERVFQAKGRAAAQALPLIAADLAQVGEGPWRSADRRRPLWRNGSGRDRSRCSFRRPQALASGVAGGTGRVGVRVPAHAVARALCVACGSPLTATSANLSGEPASNDPDVVSRRCGTASTCCSTQA